jgi:plasmid stabilization system protein ParE
MTQATFHPAARAELEEACAWYDARVAGLGQRFIRAIDVAIAAALENPNAYPRISGDARRVIVRRFPYAVIFVPIGSDVLIVSCFHSKLAGLSHGQNELKHELPAVRALPHAFTLNLALRPSPR